jgi:hypothetical protein
MDETESDYEGILRIDEQFESASGTRKSYGSISKPAEFKECGQRTDERHESFSDALDWESDDPEFLLFEREDFIQRFGQPWDLGEWQSRWPPQLADFR